ncbi:MAG: Aliphatic sulfonates import ATP-binding protein SsuB [Nocardia sp.]|uniref:ABC transporter ATP-binding protein n=1 Tax=Nocardia sp. TaxID=1821 RepID=UPI00261580E4|nr:ABC transporter ATP-binding protein [Nocardia sp.]MCU1642263.1 Aliphatic sulfonates import ATP-binding protein SsuB [Nocardia sp.]
MSELDARNRLVLTDIGVDYHSGGETVRALAPTSLTIDPGEFVCVVGPSGCGKTTLLQVLAGFLEPTSGTILVGGQHVRGPDPDRGVVFQQPNLYPWLTVRGNVEFGLRMRHMPRTERAATADRMLDLVGLREYGRRRPYELSGGQQQRCQIARVLATDPRIILMDEPFGALDAMTREKLQLELLDLWHQRRKTIVFVTHSVEEAIFLGTRVLVMGAQPGRVIYDRQVSCKGDNGAQPDSRIRSTPEFVAMRDEVAAKIYEAQGVIGSVVAAH